MNEIINTNVTPLMSTKEVADVLNVDPKTVQRTASKLFDMDVVKYVSNGGRPTMMFNENQVTAIKLELQNHSKINANTPKTELEEALLIQQGWMLLQNRVTNLQNKVTNLQAKVESQQKTIELMTPLAEFAAVVHSSQDLLTVRKACKVLGLPYGDKTLYKYLVMDGILMASHEPYQKYVDKGYFKVVEGTYNTGWSDKITLTTKVTQKGLEFLMRKYGGKKDE